MSPRIARNRRSLEQLIDRSLDVYTIHDILHALIESCYRRAGFEEDHHIGDIFFESHWREVARKLTVAESACAMLAR